MSRSTSDPARLPTADARPERRVSAAWLLPLIVIAALGWLGYRSWVMRGTLVTIRFEDGHGIEIGDTVRYRGITLGEVTDIHLNDNLDGVLVDVTVAREGQALARRGSRFWIARPRIDLRGARGLDTLTGARYVAVLPGDAESPKQRYFVGLEHAPVVEQSREGDLEIVLEAPARGGLAPGAPVTYRRCRIGAVLSVGLADDAGSVEVRAHIEAPYAALVRTRSRFWRISGAEINLGLDGLTLTVDSLEAALSGGVAMATPPLDDAGREVHTGHRFRLTAEPDDDWLDWRPAIPVGPVLAVTDGPFPKPQRARAQWKQGRLVKRTRSRLGWLLPTERGLLGPADMLVADEDAIDGTATLELAGEELSLAEPPAWTKNGLALRAIDLDVNLLPWERLRRPEAPEPCIALGDRSDDPRPISVNRITPRGADVWRLDDALAFEEAWHGATVVAREDGRVVGILIVEDGETSIRLLDVE